MRKLLLIILFLPAVATIGHDVYFYTQNQDRGFMLSDVGWLWARYHKESHDRWRIKAEKISDGLGQVENAIAQATGQAVTITPVPEMPQVAPGYEDEITVQSAQGQDTVIVIERPDNPVPAMSQQQPPQIVGMVGLFLRQKAVIVFTFMAFGILAIFYFLRLLFSAFGKIAEGRKVTRYAKGKQYKYGRK